MKEKKFIIMISSILGVVLLLFMVFEIAAIFNTNLTESSNRSLEISIALFSMFATFAGAYLGALIAGKYTLKAVEYQDKIKQDSINLKIKNKTTLAIIEIEGERTYVEQHIYNCIESQDSNSIENLSTIIGVFSKPLIDIVNSTETYEADKCVYIPILRFMGKCNRLMNYERHSFDYRSSLKYDMQHISQYRDEFLNDDERIERDKFNKDNHPYIAEAFLIYTILERELDKLKDDLLQDDIYNSKGSVDAEMNEYRFY